jgi:hypothetical protein
LFKLINRSGYMAFEVRHGLVYPGLYSDPTQYVGLSFNSEVTTFLDQAKEDVAALQQKIKPPKAEVENKTYVYKSKVTHIHYGCYQPLFPWSFMTYQPSPQVVYVQQPREGRSENKSEKEGLNAVVRVIAGLVFSGIFLWANYKLGTEFAKRSQAKQGLEENKTIISSLEKISTQATVFHYNIGQEGSSHAHLSAIYKVAEQRERVFKQLAADSNFRLACYVAFVAGSALAVVGAIASSGGILAFGSVVCLGAAGARLFKMGSEDASSQVYQNLAKNLQSALRAVEELSPNRSFYYTQQLASHPQGYPQPSDYNPYHPHPAPQPGYYPQQPGAYAQMQAMPFGSAAAPAGAPVPHYAPAPHYPLSHFPVTPGQPPSAPGFQPTH